MPFSPKNSKVKSSDKKKADKIYSRLLHYAIYGTMVIVLAIIVVISTQPESHDTRSRASVEPYESPLKLTQENQSFGTHCYTTQDIHTRIWSGTLNADNSFTIDLPFCTTESIDGLGIAVTTQRTTQFSLSAVSPSGRIVYPPTAQNSTKTLCVLPTEREIEKGKWQIILTSWEDETTPSDLSVVIGPRTSQEILNLCPR